MILPITDVRVGEPSVCGGVAVFPLFSEPSLFPGSTCDYALAHEAMAAKTVAVCEVSEQGEVGELLVDNGGDLPCLLLEGTELRGAKQHRMLNTTVLVAGRSQTRIPVACVEHGRWQYESRRFCSGSHCPPSLRRFLKRTAGGRRGSDQIALWAEIRRQHRAMGVSSTTEDLSALGTHAKMTRQVPYPASANGVAVALGGRLVSIDVFDTPATLEKTWARMTKGIATDVLEVGETQCEVTAAEVSAAVSRFRQADWHQVEAVGLGEEFRAREDAMLGSALFYGGVLLHAASVPCRPTQ
jgi:hypothetical protein